VLVEGQRFGVRIHEERVLGAWKRRVLHPTARGEDEAPVLQHVWAICPLQRDRPEIRVDSADLTFDPLHSEGADHGVQRHTNVVEGRLVQPGPDRQPRIATHELNAHILRGGTMLVPHPRCALRSPHTGEAAT
jgi:hypothetical protein